MDYIQPLVYNTVDSSNVPSTVNGLLALGGPEYSDLDYLCASMVHANTIQMKPSSYYQSESHGNYSPYSSARYHPRFGSLR